MYSPTLKVNLLGGTPSSGATITQSSQTMVIDLPANITSVENISLSGNISLSNIIASGYITAVGNITGGNLITAGNVSATGNIIGNYIIGDGSLLTGLVTSLSGNLGGNLEGNGFGANAFEFVSVTGNITGNYFVGNGSLLTGIGSTLGGNLEANLEGNGFGINALAFLSVIGNANIGNIENVGVVSATGNGTFANVTVGSGSGGSIIGANLVSANYGVFTNVSGNGVQLTDITGSNISGQVANALVAGTVYTNAQPNITSVGILSTLSVSGNANVDGSSQVLGNLTVGAGAGGSVTGANLISANLFTGVLTTPAQPNITSVGTLTIVSVSGNANVGNLSTAGNITAAYFIGDGSQLTGVPTSGSSNTAQTVTSNAQPNITSVGILTSVSVSGNATLGNVSASTGVFTNVSGNGALLTNITGANVTGTVANSTYADNAGNATVATTAGTVTTNAQSNITSVGTLTSVSVSGNANVGNLGTAGLISAAGNITGNYIIGDGSQLTNIQSANVIGNLPVRFQVKNTSGTTLVEGTPIYITGTVGASPVVEVGPSRSDTPGTATVGILEQTLIANDFGYAMSIGTLLDVDTSLYSVGQELYVGVSGGLTATRPTGGNYVQTIGKVGRVNGSNGTVEVNIWNINGLPNLNSGNVWVGNVTNGYPVETTVSSLNVATAGTVTTNAQPNITSVGTLTSVSVSGNATVGNLTTTGIISATGNGTVANLTVGSGTGGSILGANLISANLFTGVLTTPAQPNITSVGTLSALSITGNVNIGNLNAAGNIRVSSGSYSLRNVTTSISANGSDQSTATALVTEMNLISSVTLGQGVKLPAALAGMVVYITNSTATSVLVYPDVGAQINALASDVSMTLNAYSTLQFIAMTPTQWYTVGATYA